jgi:hypothetical protein
MLKHRKKTISPKFDAPQLTVFFMLWGTRLKAEATRYKTMKLRIVQANLLAIDFFTFLDI